MYFLVVSLAMICYFQVQAYQTGAPVGVCFNFLVGHPDNERSDATVTVSLMQNGNSVTCFKPKEIYYCKYQCMHVLS